MAEFFLSSFLRTSLKTLLDHVEHLCIAEQIDHTFFTNALFAQSEIKEHTPTIAHYALGVGDIGEA